MAWVCDLVEGFEHNLSTTAGGGIATGISNATISTSAAHTGTYGVRVSPTASAAGNWQIGLSLTTYKSLFLKGHVKIPTLPASDLALCQFYPGSGVKSAIWLSSAGKLIFRSFDGTTQDVSTATYSGGEWVAIEAFVAIAANGNRTHYWKLDGVDEGSFTDTQTSTTSWTSLRLGSDVTTGPAATIDWDDVVIYGSSTVETTYPTSDPNSRVRLHLPNADGTHAIGTGTYQNSAGGGITNATTTAYTYIDDVLPVGTDYVTKTAGTQVLASSYLQFAFENVADVGETGSTFGGASAFCGVAESASQAETCFIEFTIGAGSGYLISGDIGSQTIAYFRDADGGTRSSTDIDGMYIRYGSTDPAPEPRVHVLFVQVAYIPVGGTETTDSATVYVDLQASGTDIKAIEYTESATALVDLQASGTELAEYVESGTVYVDIQASGTDEYTTGGTQYTDSATIYVDLQVGPFFPLTPVLSNFTGADEEPLSENGIWADTTLRVASSNVGRPRRVSNAAGGSTIALVSSEAVYGTIFAADQEAYATISALPATTGHSLGLSVREQNVGTGSAVCYALSYALGTGFRLFRLYEGSFIQIGSTVATVASVNDVIGISVEGTSIKCWLNQNLIISETDSNVTGPGYIGFQITAFSTGRWDNFGGGSSILEYAQLTEAATVYLDLQASGTDEYTPVSGTEYTDSATVLVDLQTSATEVREIPDSATVLIDLQSSGTEITQFVDAATVLVDLQSSGTDIKAIEYTDSATPLVDLQVSSAEIAQYVEAATILVDLQASGVDIKAVDYTDSATAYFDLQTSATETREIPDANTVYVDITTTSVDIAEFVDAQTVGILLSPASAEFREILETGEVYLDLTSSGTEALEHAYLDSAEAYLDIQTSATDEAAMVDSDSVYLDIVGSTVDLAEFVDTASVGLVFTISTLDIAEVVEADTVYVDLQASGIELYIAAPQIGRPDADVTTNNWQVAPLFSKVNDQSNVTYIYATAS